LHRIKDLWTYRLPTTNSYLGLRAHRALLWLFPFTGMSAGHFRGATNPEINGLPVLSDGVFSLVIVSSNAGTFVFALVGGSLTKF